MIDHVGLEVSDYNKSVEFYKKALAPLGYVLLREISGYAGFGMPHHKGPLATIWIHQGETTTRKAHIAINAPNRAIVDAFYKAGLEASGKDGGKPGVREHYHADYYGAFVLDPDGHNIEAVCHLPQH